MRRMKAQWKLLWRYKFSSVMETPGTLKNVSQILIHCPPSEHRSWCTHKSENWLPNRSSPGFIALAPVEAYIHLTGISPSTPCARLWVGHWQYICFNFYLYGIWFASFSCQNWKQKFLKRLNQSWIISILRAWWQVICLTVLLHEWFIFIIWVIHLMPT